MSESTEYPQSPSTSSVAEELPTTADAYKDFIQRVCDAAYEYAHSRGYKDLSVEGFFAEALASRHNGTPPMGTTVIVEEGHIHFEPEGPVDEIPRERTWDVSPLDKDDPDA